MKDQKSLILAIALALTTFAIFAIGAPSTAFAQIGGGQCNSDSDCYNEWCIDGECQQCLKYSDTNQCIVRCQSNFDCPSGTVCNSYGYCLNEPSVCDAGENNLSNYDKTIAILPASSNVYVGKRVAFSGYSSYRNNASNASCSYEEGCGTSYASYMKYTNASCGNGEGCTAEDGNLSSYIQIKHSHLVYPKGGSGKYTITEIKGTCNSSGSKIVVLTRCNC